MGVAAVCVGCPAAHEVPDHPPNLLIVTIDTLRADHVGAYGSASGATPTLDRLAEEGVLFEQTMGATPITLPSHASLFSGQHPPKHGVRHNAIYRVKQESILLAERLAEAGYHTAALVGAVVLARETGIDQGFQTFVDGGAAQQATTTTVQIVERSAGEVTELALDVIDELPEPFALWIHYYDPHLVWQAPEPFKSRFPDDPYSAEIAYVDHSLTRVLDAIDAQQRLERTLLVLTSDHGESLGEHGEPSHSYTVYDAALHVPLIIAGPGLPKGQRISNVVGLVDVAPTLLELLGLPELADADGVSLAPMIRGESDTGPAGAYSETLATQLDYGLPPLFSWRTSTHRFVEAPTPELYDSQEDPRELDNLLPSTPLSEVVGEARASIGRIRSEERAGEGRVVNEVERQQLESLGYVVPEVAMIAAPEDPTESFRWIETIDQAELHVVAGRYPQAIELLEPIREKLPNSARLQGLLGRAFAGIGDVQRGYRFISRAVELNPRSGDDLAALAILELQMGAFDAAAKHFEQAFEQTRARPHIQMGAMWLAWRRGDREAADAFEARAIELDPTNWRNRRLLAAFWSQLGDPRRAASHLEAAVRIAPDLPDLRRDVALSWIALGDRERAAPHLEILADEVDTPSFRNSMAMAIAVSGDIPRAIEILEAVLASHPGDAVAKQYLASLEKRLAVESRP